MPNAKNEGLKYEMSYVNAGFNSGVELKPAKGGKAQLKITMYGGGNNKVMNIGPLPENITNLIKGYEISEDEKTPEITEELQKYFDDKKVQLSLLVIKILQEADAKVQAAIKQTFT